MKPSRAQADALRALAEAQAKLEMLGAAERKALALEGWTRAQVMRPLVTPAGEVALRKAHLTMDVLAVADGGRVALFGFSGVPRDPRMETIGIGTRGTRFVVGETFDADEHGCLSRGDESIPAVLGIAPGTLRPGTLAELEVGSDG